MRQSILGVAFALVWVVAALPAFAAEPLKVRVAYFPNITHAQALIGRESGAFARAMGEDVQVEWKLFSAGPPVIQALFAGELDLAYLGTGPAIVGYVRSHGEAVRIVAGAADGGAALVVRDASDIRGPEDFRGKRVATPQLGNTQDLALRAWLAGHGLETMERGGDVRVIPLPNPDQFMMFRRGEIDGAWTAEPWASRLVHEAGGRIYLDEREVWSASTDGRFATTVLVAHPRFLSAHPDLAARWIAAHAAVTDWIVAHPEEAKAATNEAFARDTGKSLKGAVLDDAWSRVIFTTDPVAASIERMAQWAFDNGFLGRRRPELSSLMDGRWLTEAVSASDGPVAR